MNKRHRGITALIIILVLLVAMLVGGYFALKYIYPLKYQDAIAKYSAKYDLDPYFVSAIIWTESKFRDKAKSGDGAQGLMQLMPDTAAWIEKKIDDKNVTAENAAEPEVNIEMGCWYLNYLYGEFGDNELVAAAYNAGHNKVKSWLDDKTVSKNGTKLDDIPYEETRNYVKRVDDAHDFYKFLYKFD